jgi:peptide methionine sulfoxide reductase MsrA
MTRTSEMTNHQAKTRHRTTAQVAELCSQSAEDYHQQYLYKVPNGYCPDHSTGVSRPVGILKADD